MYGANRSVILRSRGAAKGVDDEQESEEIFARPGGAANQTDGGFSEARKCRRHLKMTAFWKACSSGFGLSNWS
jgi:hypothetical protein